MYIEYIDKHIDACCGRLAQLVERFPYKEDVGSSSLSTPTIKDQITDVIWSFILCFETRELHQTQFGQRSSARVSRGRKLEYFEKQKCFEKYSIEDPFNANEQDEPLNAHHLKKELRKWFLFIERFLTS